MRYAMAVVALASAVALHGQTSFQPAMMYHVSFAQILAYGEVADLHQEPATGAVPLTARVYSVTHPSSCVEDGALCRIAYYIVVHDPDNIDGPLVWALGTAGPLKRAEWLPPSSTMARHNGRLRLEVAPLDRHLSDGVTEAIEFEVGYNGAWVR